MTDREKLTIESLEVQRAPGFETDGFAIEDTSPDINLVHGPNAAGKTTTANAIESLLWPSTADGGERLTGHFKLDGESWRVNVEGGSANYQRDGQEASAPALPGTQQRDRYRLSLHDLLQRETRDEHFAETIERESAGGFDLAGAADELDYGGGPITRGKGVYQDAKQAIEQWREARSAASDLEERRSRLSKLQRQLEAAKAARKKQEAIEAAIDFREANKEHEEAVAGLESFPDVLERVDGDEVDELDAIEAELDECEEQLEEAQEMREEARSEIESLGLEDLDLTDSDIQGFKEQRDRIRELSNQIDDLEAGLEDQKARRESAREDVPLDLDTADLENLEPAAWSAVSDFARKAQEVRAARHTRQRVEDWGVESDSESPTSSADTKTLDRGRNALESWLLANPKTDTGTGSNAAFRIGAVAGLVVSLAGVALGALVNPLLFAVVVLGVVLAAYGYQHREGPETGDSERKAHRETFEQTDLEPPEEWTTEGVRDRLLELYDTVAEQAVVEERQQRKEAILGEYDVEDLEGDLEERREQFREQVGTAPEMTDIELVVIAARVTDWQQAHDEVLGTKERLEETRAKLEGIREDLQEDLDPYGYDEITDTADATQSIRDLESRLKNHEKAVRDRDEATDTIETTEAAIADLKNDRETLFDNLDLDDGDREELESLCAQVDDYDEAKERVNDTEVILEERQENLQTLPAYEPELEERPIDDLREALEEAKERAAEHDELQERIADIQADIRQAKADTTVEEAIQEKDRALGALEEQLVDDQASMVGEVLVDHVQSETVDANRPAVFKRAAEILATITHGRYRLDLEDGENTFRAYDTTKERGFALEELSSGTRIQVLLAVRLAFVDEHEQGPRPPICFDETLANTDDRRAEVIVDSLLELAKDGRQLFYFTAQGDEVAKWESAIKATEGVEGTTIDLAAVRDLDGGIQIDAIPDGTAITQDPPDPADHDHASYGDALDVDGFDPNAGAGTAHLWYVVEEPELLYDFLDLGIERWGQLENLLERGRDGVVPADDDAIERIRQNAAALEAFVTAWNVGRGEPVDRSVLEATSAVSGNFIDRVSELARELNGDGSALVEALRDGQVNRFRRGKAEDLEDYLRENDYIVPRDSLPSEDIRLRVVERLIQEGVDRDEAGDQADAVLTRLSAT
jgi:uncharacterized protein YhaN